MPSGKSRSTLGLVVVKPLGGAASGWSCCGGAGGLDSIGLVSLLPVRASEDGLDSVGLVSLLPVRASEDGLG